VIKYKQVQRVVGWNGIVSTQHVMIAGNVIEIYATSSHNLSHKLHSCKGTLQEMGWKSLCAYLIGCYVVNGRGKEVIGKCLKITKRKVLRR
jgi:hypothetical protein